MMIFALVFEQHGETYREKFLSEKGRDDRIRKLIAQGAKILKVYSYDNDKEPDPEYVELIKQGYKPTQKVAEVRSSTNGDFGPSNPWCAPGMKVSDFINI